MFLVIRPLYGSMSLRSAVGPLFFVNGRGFGRGLCAEVEAMAESSAPFALFVGREDIVLEPEVPTLFRGRPRFFGPSGVSGVGGMFICKANVVGTFVGV